MIKLSCSLPTRIRSISYPGPSQIHLLDHRRPTLHGRVGCDTSERRYLGCRNGEAIWEFVCAFYDLASCRRTCKGGCDHRRMVTWGLGCRRFKDLQSYSTVYPDPCGNGSHLIFYAKLGRWRWLQRWETRKCESKFYSNGLDQHTYIGNFPANWFHKQICLLSQNTSNLQQKNWNINTVFNLQAIAQ